MISVPNVIPFGEQSWGTPGKSTMTRWMDLFARNSLRISMDLPTIWIWCKRGILHKFQSLDISMFWTNSKLIFWALEGELCQQIYEESDRTAWHDEFGEVFFHSSKQKTRSLSLWGHAKSLCKILGCFGFPVSQLLDEFCGNPKFIGRQLLSNAKLLSSWGLWLVEQVQKCRFDHLFGCVKTRETWDNLPTSSDARFPPSVKFSYAKPSPRQFNSKNNTIWLSMDNHTDSQYMCEHIKRYLPLQIVHLYNYIHAHLNSFTLPSCSLHIRKYIGNTLRPKQCQYIHTMLCIYSHTHTKHIYIYTHRHTTISSATHCT